VRLPKIGALDLRPARPHPPTKGRVQCADCARPFTGVEGQRCIRCELVTSVAQDLGLSQAEAWRHVSENPVTAGMVVDEHAERWLAKTLLAEPNPVADRTS
jgi:hypothetical protein